MSAIRNKSAAASEARDQISKVLRRASSKKERVVLTRRGKPFAALIPIEDLVLLEELEDRQDAAEARAALRDWEASGRKSTPLEAIARELGIKL